LTLLSTEAKEEVNTMHLITNIGFILLAIWLIITGIMTALSIGSNQVVHVLLGILACVAGVLILLGH